MLSLKPRKIKDSLVLNYPRCPRGGRFYGWPGGISFHPKGKIALDLSREGEDAAAEKEPRVPVCHTSVAWGLGFETVCSISFCLEILKSVHTDVITVN